MQSTRDDHRIRYTRFDVRVDSERDVFGMPSRLEEYFHRVIEPALAQSLDAHAPPETIGIDRLEIDLGTINPDRYDADVRDRVDKAVRRALANVPPAARRKRQVVAGATLRPTIAEAGVALSDEQQYLYFLETGTLPWHTPESVAALEARLMQLPAARLRRLAEAIVEAARRDTVRERLELQSGARFIAWLDAAATRFGIDLPASGPYPRRDAAISTKRQAGLAEEPTSEKTADAIRSAGRQSPGARESGAETEDVTPGRVTEEAAGSPADNVEAEVYLVTGAGICLLHPFLPALFERTGLTDSNATFRTEADRERAVHLLSFLTNAVEFAEEPAMTLFKVLCGWPLRRPVRRRLQLSDAENDECAAVLASCIAHWARLRNTSTAALQTEFLQREGRLQQHSDHWHLVVEQRSIDVLLDSLPWSIARVRLPWCPKSLSVDWR